MPRNMDSVDEVIRQYPYSRNILVLTNDDGLAVNASVIRADAPRRGDGKYNWGILDLNDRENEDVESIMEDFYWLASHVHRGGHVLVPERTYWHLPCGMESVEILCESVGLILEAPGANTGKTVMCTIP